MVMSMAAASGSVCVCGFVCNGEVTRGRAPEPLLCAVVRIQGFAESLQHSSSPQC